MKYKKTLFILFLYAATTAICAYWNIICFSKTPKDISDKTDKTLLIKKGLSFSDAAKLLYKNGFITNSFKMKLFAKLKGKVNIKAGEYVLSASMPPIHILEILEKGKVKLYKFTIPEGLNIKEIATIFADENFCSEEKFIAKAMDKNFTKSFNINADTLEGYIFPDTYLFPKGLACEDLISVIIKHFFKVFKKDWKKRAEQLGFTTHQVVTLASMIEKETMEPKERALVSSTFHNRLKINMKLQSDPTAIYGVENFKGYIKKKDLKKDTPYNTYKIKGLPPGPIANPGKAAIYAALFPADTKFYFFVSKNNGTHKFSKTFEEHAFAVRKFKLR
ncbi:MAG: endolytic transglycosylase MltG [Deltaproteobacteria bacterium]|nr:endolytic transglycosylase MltG [Deltaproteobacteria bacterium]